MWLLTIVLMSVVTSPVLQAQAQEPQEILEARVKKLEGDIYQILRALDQTQSALAVCKNDNDVSTTKI